MTKPFSISLKAGERIFINGAVLRVDRKVTIEFLNDVAFLLEAHVMQQEQTTTPCRQLYFSVQAMLIDPVNAEITKQLFNASYQNLREVVSNVDLLGRLAEVKRLVEIKRYYDALKTLRGCFPVEDGIIAGGPKSIQIMKRSIDNAGEHNQYHSGKRH